MTKIEILNQYKKQKHNTYRECDVINAMEKYLESYKQDQAITCNRCYAFGFLTTIFFGLVSAPFLSLKQF